LIERRAKDRVPAAYLTHEALLGDYRFYVDERVIVPRSFIAELIPEQFQPWIADPEAVTNVLELCTGSGCLAIMLTDAFPNAQVDAVDLSTDALEVARKNVTDYGLQDRIVLHHSDLYDKLPKKKYDLIVTNPPYVNNASMAKLPAEYRAEPQMALAGGDDGMDIVRRIVAGAKRRARIKILHERAVITVHHDPKQLAGFAQHEIAAGRRKRAEEALQQPIVAEHVARLSRVELESNFAVVLASTADRHRFGKLKRLARDGVDFESECGALRGVNRYRDNARIDGQD
jgi:HemK-like putative methylase